MKITGLFLCYNYVSEPDFSTVKSPNESKQGLACPHIKNTQRHSFRYNSYRFIPLFSINRTAACFQNSSLFIPNFRKTNSLHLYSNVMLFFHLELRRFSYLNSLVLNFHFTKYPSLSRVSLKQFLQRM